MKENKVSLCMDIFGYSFFVSFILAPLPGLLVSFLKRFNEEKASEWSLSFLIILDTILCVLGLCSETNVLNNIKIFGDTGRIPTVKLKIPGKAFLKSES